MWIIVMHKRAFFGKCQKWWIQYNERQLFNVTEPFRVGQVKHFQMAPLSQSV